MRLLEMFHRDFSHVHEDTASAENSDRAYSLRHRLTFVNPARYSLAEKLVSCWAFPFATTAGDGKKPL